MFLPYSPRYPQHLNKFYINMLKSRYITIAGGFYHHAKVQFILTDYLPGSRCQPVFQAGIIKNNTTSQANVIKIDSSQTWGW
jgi:hypothetical protein